MKPVDGRDPTIHGAYAPAFFALAATRVLDKILVTGATGAKEQGLDIPARAMSALILLTEGPMGVAELAQRLGVTPAAVIKNTRTLRDRGLIESRDDEHDARRRPLHLTPAGRKAVETVDAFVRRAQRVYSEIFDGPRELRSPTTPSALRLTDGRD
jgi:DNA-binding MarR family transcriptional regulator